MSKQLMRLVLIGYNFVVISFVCLAQNGSEKPTSVSELITKWKTDSKQIVFYGKVIDQFSKPVEDAVVTVNAPEPTGILRERARRFTVRTDRAGHFEISEKTCQVFGLNLVIEDIAKDGFVFTTGGSPRSFLYDKHYTACHVPEKSTPIVYQIRKKESEQFVLFKSHDLNFQIRAEKAGTAVGCDFVRRSLIAAEQPHVSECRAFRRCGQL